MAMIPFRTPVRLRWHQPHLINRIESRGHSLPEFIIHLGCVCVVIDMNSISSRVDAFRIPSKTPASGDNVSRTGVILRQGRDDWY